MLSNHLTWVNAQRISYFVFRWNKLKTTPFKHIFTWSWGKRALRIYDIVSLLHSKLAMIKYDWPKICCLPQKSTSQWTHKREYGINLVGRRGREKKCWLHNAVDQMVAWTKNDPPFSSNLLPQHHQGEYGKMVSFSMIVNYLAQSLIRMKRINFVSDFMSSENNKS